MIDWRTEYSFEFYQKAHDGDIISLGISPNGRFIMTCSNTTELVIWDLKGQVLAEVDTCLLANTCAKISPCGRFVAASGFAPDAKVWEIKFTKNGEFQEIRRAYELKGHSTGVYDLAFDTDSSHMVTVSKDGTWKFFDTRIEYHKGEEAKLLVTGKYEQGGNYALVALTPHADVVAIAASDTLMFFSTSTGSMDAMIEGVFTGPITRILFDSAGLYLFASGDKQIRVLHNVTGYRCRILDARLKLKQSQTSATKERLEKVIEDCEKFLKQYN